MGERSLPKQRGYAGLVRCNSLSLCCILSLLLLLLLLLLFYYVEPDLIAIEMLAFLSNSSRNQNDNYLAMAIPTMRRQLLYKL